MTVDTIDDVELSDEQYKDLLRIRGGCSCHISPPCFNCSDPITEKEFEQIFGYSFAYHAYMKLANNLFEHLRNDTEETPEEKKEVEEKGKILWEQMSDDERSYADEQILRTVIWIKGSKQNEKNG